MRLLYLLSCIVALPAHAQPAPVRESAAALEPMVSPEPATVRFRVIVEAPRAYKKVLEEGLDLARWQRDERVTMALLERLVAEARKATAETLAADGYFSANVQSRIEAAPGESVIVRVTVEPGSRTLIRGVDLNFEGPVTADDEGRKRIAVVKETWGLAPGAAFRQAEWDAAKEGAVGRLARGRYAAAKIVESEARIDPEARAADLRLKLDSGPVFHAGPTVVSGLKRYPPSVVENLNPTRPGEPYDATKLDLYQRRLLETGYFNAVLFTIEPDPSQAAAAPLNVTVIEAPSQRIETGIAFRTDTGPGVTLNYTNADVFEAARRLRSRVDVNQKEQKVQVTLDTPPRPAASGIPTPAAWSAATCRARSRAKRWSATPTTGASKARLRRWRSRRTSSARRSRHRPARRITHSS